MDFKEATDVLTDCISLSDVAEAAGVALNSVARARMEGPNSRPPPEGWEAVVARLARRRAGDLEELARDLRSGPHEGIEGRAE